MINSGTPAEGPRWRAMPLAGSLDKNIKTLRDIFANCPDVVFRELALDQASDVRLVLVFVDNLVDKTRIAEYVVRPLSREAPRLIRSKEAAGEHIVDYIHKEQGPVYFGNI
jgi:hypothetical protein